MPDPAYQPQPDADHNQRRTDAERGEQSLVAPDALRGAKPGTGGKSGAAPQPRNEGDPTPRDPAHD